MTTTTPDAPSDYDDRGDPRSVAAATPDAPSAPLDLGGLLSTDPHGLAFARWFRNKPPRYGTFGQALERRASERAPRFMLAVNWLWPDTQLAPSWRLTLHGDDGTDNLEWTTSDSQAALAAFVSGTLPNVPDVAPHGAEHEAAHQRLNTALGRMAKAIGADRISGEVHTPGSAVSLRWGAGRWVAQFSFLSVEYHNVLDLMVAEGKMRGTGDTAEAAVDAFLVGVADVCGSIARRMSDAAAALVPSLARKPSLGEVSSVVVALTTNLSRDRFDAAMRRHMNLDEEYLLKCWCAYLRDPLAFIRGRSDPRQGRNVYEAALAGSFPFDDKAPKVSAWEAEEATVRTIREADPDCDRPMAVGFLRALRGLYFARHGYEPEVRIEKVANGDVNLSLVNPVDRDAKPRQLRGVTFTGVADTLVDGLLEELERRPRWWTDDDDV